MTPNVQTPEWYSEGVGRNFVEYGELLNDGEVEAERNSDLNERTGVKQRGVDEKNGVEFVDLRPVGGPRRAQIVASGEEVEGEKKRADRCSYWVGQRELEKRARVSKLFPRQNHYADGVLKRREKRDHRMNVIVIIRDPEIVRVGEIRRDV